MKFSRRLAFGGCLAGVAASAFVMRGEFFPVAANVVGGSGMEAALFRLMLLPGGSVMGRRPPVESVPALGDLIDRSPGQGELYALRAQEEERALNSAQAERDWKQSAQLSAQKGPALLALADFYQRRANPQSEVTALLSAAALPAEGLDRFRSVNQQPAWQALQRADDVARRCLLDPSVRGQIYEAWLSRYPHQAEPYRAYLDVLVATKSPAATAFLGRITAAFPNDLPLQIESEAKVQSLSGDSSAALAVYSRRFTPLWAADLRTAYYQQLAAAHELRAFLASARADTAAEPMALTPALKIFFYYESAGDKARANAELLALETRRSAAKSTWTASDWLTVAPLFRRVGNYDECARAYYTAYQLPASSAADRNQALAEMIDLLLDVPEQPFQLGRRDLSLYANIATMDPHPGFLNGILSLALNNTSPRYQFEAASQTAVTYFHRAAAARFLEILQQTDPSSERTVGLEAQLFAAYAAYGQNEPILRLAPAWLQKHSDAPGLVPTALLLADAYFNTGSTKEEFALYDTLLNELAARSEHVPLGPDALEASATARSIRVAQENPPVAPAPNARSADYARVLDRYISRLTQAHQPQQALTLFRREIDNNPADPGLYNRFALFLEQNRLDADLAQTYQRAFAHFKDESWAAKLGRLYLRRKEYTAYQSLTRQITSAFTGSELAQFLNGVAPNAKLNPVLYRQVNLFAHTRFPHNLTFIKHLLTAYQTKATADPAAYERLLRESWFYDAGLRTTFFEYLSRTGKLEAELAALPPLETAQRQKNVAAISLRAEGEGWLTNFEASAPAFVQLAGFTPGDRLSDARALNLERSLASMNRDGAFTEAVRLARQSVDAAPGDAAALTAAGEIYAERELYPEAAPWWRRISSVEPGVAERYLESATVFWDYFRYDDALREIADARRVLDSPERFAYQAGAIYENKNDFQKAIHEYVAAAIADPPGLDNTTAQRRLIILAARKTTALLVDQQVQVAARGPFNPRLLALRTALLENQNRISDIHQLLDALLPSAGSLDDVATIRTVAQRFGFDDTVVRSYERSVTLDRDPVEKLQLRVELALFLGTHQDAAGAQRDLKALLQENPNVLGVIRASVDFDWRHKASAQAVSTLVAAAGRASEPFRSQLLAEGAQKATDSGNYAEARRLLDQLLLNDPYNADLLSRKAATYALEKDANGLVAFYAAVLPALDRSPLPATEKGERAAALRRGYIHALVVAGQFPAALDQYEQLVSHYPEDEGLARETARFASSHNLQDMLLGYFAKAVADSPRDYRWPLILAHLDVATARYTDALSAFDKAAYIRPDRTDILDAKADLETRLLRFEDALATSQKLYRLSYQNTRYLLQQATLQAIRGHHAEAVQLLRSAYIDAHPNEPGSYVSVMRQLDSWRMFSQVDRTYHELRPLMPQMTVWTNEAVTLELKALVALHQPTAAIHAVSEAFNGIKGMKESSNRDALSQSLGAEAAEFLAPEEKEQFAKLIGGAQPLAAPFSRYPLASAAGLNDIAAAALVQQLRSSTEPAASNLQQLQSSRLMFKALGAALEAAIPRASPDDLRDTLIREAFGAYGKAGSAPDQLRIAETMARQNSQALADSEFAAVFVRAYPALSPQLAALAAVSPKYADAVVAYQMANANAADALEAIGARGRSLTPRWVEGYKGLAGLYFSSPQTWTGQAFDALLGPHTVAAQLTAWKAAPGKLFTGPDWFYYAARYGDYLGMRRSADAADFLPASLESAPLASNNYLTAADAFFELQDDARARDLYQQALTLSPQRADVHDRLGVLDWKTGQREAAVAQWREALQLLTMRVEQGPLPPDYWATGQLVLTHLNETAMTGALRPAVDTLLDVYTKRNRSYNINPFVESILAHSSNTRQSMDWIVAIARRTNLPEFVDAALNVPSVPVADREILYRYRIERLAALFAASAGDAATQAQNDLVQARVDYARYLLAQARGADAWTVLAAIEPASRRPAALVLEAGAASGHLEELLTAYGTDPAQAPSGDEILALAGRLWAEGQRESGLHLRNFEYARELETDSAAAAAYFGLAQVRLDEKRLPDALALLQTVTVSVGRPFENYSEAVRLLEEAGLPSEAVSYAERWKTAEPWNAEAQLAFARLKADRTLLDGVRRNEAVPYRIRAQAARAIGSLKQPAAEVSPSEKSELSLLTRSSISPAEARKPFWVFARLEAARQAADSASRVTLYREAISLDPTLRNERLDLAKDAFESHQEALGLAALDSYASTYGMFSSGSPPASVLPQIQEMAASVLVDRKNFAEAIALYNQILVTATGEARTRIQSIRSAAQTASELAARNASRQPVVTDNLSQTTIVKPKLTALPSGVLTR